jgi:mycofactocin glycosyltransferase
VRPSVSVIVPFAGSQSELESLAARLRALTLGDGDEVLVADNRPSPVPLPGASRVRWLPAPGPAAPSFARNVAARVASGEWLVFLDADTEPAPGLLDAYFDPGPADDVAVLAGGIDDRAESPTLAARYVSARAMMAQETTLAHPHGPHAQTANCAVRRAAFASVGSFDESARWGEDADLGWRLRDAGWRLEERPGARVAHRNRATLRALAAQQSGHGAGAAWLDRRHPGASPAPRARELAGQVKWCVSRAARAAAGRQGQEAAFALVDLLCRMAFESGRRRSNAPKRHTSG